MTKMTMPKGEITSGTIYEDKPGKWKYFVYDSEGTKICFSPIFDTEEIARQHMSAFILSWNEAHYKDPIPDTPIEYNPHSPSISEGYTSKDYYSKGVLVYPDGTTR